MDTALFLDLGLRKGLLLARERDAPLRELLRGSQAKRSITISDSH